MSVYVDDMRAPLGRMVMCHMLADTTDELLAMADRIGVQRRWLQKAGTPHEHFDVSLGARAKAVAAGAVEIEMHKTGEIIARKRAAGKEPTAMSNPKPLTPEEEAELRERYALATTGAVWLEDVRRLLATLDAERARPDALREAAQAVVDTVEPAEDEFHYLVRPVRIANLRATLDAERARPDTLREALADAICSTFDMAHHDHEAFLEPDHCESGLEDADQIIPFLRAALAGKEPTASPDPAPPSPDAEP